MHELHRQHYCMYTANRSPADLGSRNILLAAAEVAANRKVAAFVRSCLASAIELDRQTGRQAKCSRKHGRQAVSLTNHCTMFLYDFLRCLLRGVYDSLASLC